VSITAADPAANTSSPTISSTVARVNSAAGPRATTGSRAPSADPPVVGAESGGRGGSAFVTLP
jgi:hypothetical protein